MKYYNPIIGDQYEGFVSIMRQCAKKEMMPQLMEIREVSEIKIKDVYSLIAQFTKDTGLSMKFSAEINATTGELHAFLFVDYPEDYDEPKLLN